MMTFQILLGASLVVLLILDVCGLPVKDPRPQLQGGSGIKAASQGVAAPFQADHVSFSAPAVKTLSHPTFVQTPAEFVNVNPMAGLYQAAPVYYGSQMPAYYVDSQQAGAAQSPPTADWFVAPPSFEDASTDAEDLGAVLPPAQPVGPILQSGETSNIVKEAELGHYQRETEESGYPAVPINPVLGGLLPYPFPYPLPYRLPYPAFDYRLLFGQYPPGTYTTFSRNHERGRDYSQSIHYLKEHGPDAPENPQNPGSGQHKLFQRTQ
ncbi:PREDICTED: uncharacterized protein LOC107082397 [Cyprinodon variegatus]|uniref:uncharacterized protein LOC107082397 n=1 Tax=Cyprinodon variegatus TaxID=28743 RepID=UPI0007428F7D|nr:PREDICTED: uncharacterized protein LOC107082397 [Cyprinodon variegatus]